MRRTESFPSAALRLIEKRGPTVTDSSACGRVCSRVRCRVLGEHSRWWGDPWEDERTEEDGREGTGSFLSGLHFLSAYNVPGSILCTVHTVPLSNVCLLQAEEIH